MVVPNRGPCFRSSASTGNAAIVLVALSAAAALASGVPLVCRAALLGSGPAVPGLADAESWSLALSVICVVGYGVAGVVFTMWRGQVLANAVGAGLRRSAARKVWRGLRDRELYDVWRFLVRWAPGRVVPPIGMSDAAWRSVIIARVGMGFFDTTRTPLGLVVASATWTLSAIGCVAAVGLVVVVVHRIEAAQAASRAGRR